MTHICKSEDRFLEGVLSCHLPMGSRDGSEIDSSTQQASLPTLHIFSPPATKHRCGISSVVDVALKELWWKNLIASSDS